MCVNVGWGSGGGGHKLRITNREKEQGQLELLTKLDFLVSFPLFFFFLTYIYFLMYMGFF